MWVAKFYRKQNYFYLWNREPIEVNDDIFEYDSLHDPLRIPSFYSPMFEGMKQPIEVELVRDYSDSPMFYAQKILDCNGNPNVYISRSLEYRFHRPYKKWKWFGKTITGHWHVSTLPPEGNYTDLTVNVSTSSHRMRPQDFKWSVEDGYVPVTIKIKNINEKCMELINEIRKA